VAQFGDGHKRPQLAQLHSRSLSEGFNHFIGRIMRDLVDLAIALVNQARVE
jgi:hypothetical protein